LSIRIGLPQGLLHYQYGIVWERFLHELGAEVVISGDTTKTTLDHGSVLDEVCLPVKVYFGHVCELYKEVDYLFSPRLISVSARQYTCPQIIGITDMLRNNLKNLPPIIDVNVNLRQNQRGLYQAIVSVGRTLGSGPIPSLYAWYCASKYQKQQRISYQTKTGRQRIGLIGHRYILYDRQISMNVINKIREFGFVVETPETVSCHQSTAAVKDWKRIFWSSSQQIAGAALVLMQPPQPVDGLIFITSFSCGPDTLIGELISRRAQALNIPFMLLTVDEHTAEAGFITRLEAFTDMVSRRGKP
jgi:predicted nucleotide-binding protein (sugar kinase/HSP70/actin superfamily)